ncbi:MAG: hypothetical protein WC966_10080 [Bradymonadales bacterium]|jgi:hypothetical protein
MRRFLALLAIFMIVSVFYACESGELITKEQYGPKCNGSTVNEFGRCNRNQYCDTKGDEDPSNDECIRLREDCDCVKDGEKCPEDIPHSNGFGYCMLGYSCSNNICHDCNEGESPCRDEVNGYICVKNMNRDCTACLDGFCKLGSACVPNTSVNACGDSCDDCVAKYAQRASCKNKLCVETNCTVGECATADGRCLNLETSMEACGEECKDCRDIANVLDVSCEAASCVVKTCQEKFCKNGNTCIHNDTHCGAECIDCTNLENVLNATCNDGSCIVDECKSGYCKNGNSCVSSDTQCGADCIDCTSIDNAASTVCDAGVCKLNSCVEGYCLNANECIKNDSNKFCGPNCTDCASIIENAKSTSCVNDVCVLEACESNYCKDADSCINTDLKCGSGCHNCSTLPNTNSGECRQGACYATSCKSGYTSNGRVCCIDKAHASVIEDNADICSYECNTGITECNGVCVNIKTDMLHCGGCNAPCAGNCTDGRCSIKRGCQDCLEQEACCYYPYPNSGFAGCYEGGHEGYLCALPN